MSDTPNFGFGKFVPGFDFLQNLAGSAVKGASQSIPQIPNLGNWVAPTLNVEELDKRIEELKAVQFWLDQNAMALKATIQALEVQKMTLATLKGMNFNMGDLANAFKLKATETVASTVQKAAEKTAEKAADVASAAASDAAEDSAKPKAKAKKGDAAAAAGVIDPMQWWGSLTQQFQHIATTAMQEAAKKTAFDATKNMAAGLAKDALKTATGMAQAAAKTATAGVRASAPAKKAAKKKAPAVRRRT